MAPTGDCSTIQITNNKILNADTLLARKIVGIGRKV